MSAFLGHDCGPYCRDGKHAKVVWCIPDSVFTPRYLLEESCQMEGVAFVHCEPAPEAGPVPAGVVGVGVEVDTQRRYSEPVRNDATPYLLVWHETQGQEG